jgi:hypothetical protein
MIVPFESIRQTFMNCTNIGFSFVALIVLSSWFLQADTVIIDITKMIVFHGFCVATCLWLVKSF